MLRIFYLGESDAKTVQAIKSRLPAIMEAVRRRLDVVDAKLQRKIQREKLEGQVLHHRSGKLVNSIRMIPAEISGSRITGRVEGAGGPAWYGAIHEQMPGSEFTSPRAYEIVPTTKKALSFMLNGKRIIVKRVKHPAAKERSFMRSAYAEMEGQIAEELQAAIDEVIDEETL